MPEVKTICVIGLGYIGLPLCVVLAEAGFNVSGLEIDKTKIEKLKRFEAPIYEPQLNELLKKYGNKIEFSDNASQLLGKADAIFITIGTPFYHEGAPDYSALEKTIDVIGNNLKKGQLILLKSTVSLGTTENMVKPRLEKVSGLKAGKDFLLAFSPERTVAGNAIAEFKSLPKLIGGINKESTDKAAEILSKIGGKIIKVSSPKVAELCKILDNYYRAMNIALVNEISILCEKANISAFEVINAVNDSYERTKLFKPGLGADGPCLLKDTRMFDYSAKQYGIQSKLANDIIEISILSDKRLADMILRFIKKNKIKKPKIAMIGLAFKGVPETDDIRESPSLKIYGYLKNKVPSDVFSFYDPLIKTFEGRHCENSLNETLKGANIAIFLTNHPKIMNLNSAEISRNMRKPAFIIDCWHNIANLDYLQKAKGIEFFRIGEPYNKKL